MGDLITPVSAYLRVRDDYPQSALMESSDYHGGENAKSFIALHPIASISIEHGKGVMRMPDGMVEERDITPTWGTAELFNLFLDQFEITGPDADYCGLYGYTFV